MVYFGFISTETVISCIINKKTTIGVHGSDGSESHFFLRSSLLPINLSVRHLEYHQKIFYNFKYEALASIILF